MADRRVIGDASIEAGTRTGIPARFYEKDFYITAVLRVLSERMPSEFVFKGGTSLSKAYSLIDRFSEDIDLLVLPDPDTGEQVDLIMDKMTALAVEALGPGAICTNLEAVPGNSRRVNLGLPLRTVRASTVSKSIQLEPGRRGGPLPSELRIIGPLLADLGLGLTGPDFDSFEVRVLHPARTLVEKLFATNELAAGLVADPGRLVKSREARHFYDICRLLTPGSPALGMLNVPGLLGDIVADCHAVTSQWFSDGSPTPTPSNLADSPAFTDAAVGLRIRGAYDTACRDLCHPGTAIPPWDEVVATVSEQRHLLQA
ncbi:MAG TPA: nucleotidyl transferase AbiEii/AbiGii toxin family protein [Dermatophilaceae bacterium]